MVAWWLHLVAGLVALVFGVSLNASVLFRLWLLVFTCLGGYGLVICLGDGCLCMVVGLGCVYYGRLC